MAHKMIGIEKTPRTPGRFLRIFSAEKTGPNYRRFFEERFAFFVVFFAFFFAIQFFIFVW
ncbi:MAG: hypothetical protein AAB573_01995 [Patescibacteria group bacterium]